MRTVVVRPPRPADAPELAEMWLDHAEYYVALDSDAFQIPERDGLVEWFEELLAREIPSNELSLVAKLDDRVVGFVDARIVEPMTTASRQLVREVGDTRLYIDALGVHRSHWRRGIGKHLLDAAEQWGRERGAVIACLDTYARGPVAVPFYERQGYTTKSFNYRKRLT